MIFQALDDNLDGVLDWSEFQEHSCSRLTPRIPVLGLVCRRCAMYFSSEAAACDRIGKSHGGGGERSHRNSGAQVSVRHHET